MSLRIGQVLVEGIVQTQVSHKESHQTVRVKIDRDVAVLQGGGRYVRGGGCCRKTAVRWRAVRTKQARPGRAAHPYLVRTSTRQRAPRSASTLSATLTAASSTRVSDGRLRE